MPGSTYCQPSIVYIIKGLNATFKSFEQKLSSDGYGLEFECKSII